MVNPQNKPKNTIREESENDEPKLRKTRKKVKLTFSANEDVKKTIGLFLLLVSIFMLLAFTSYFFFTWRTDMSEVSSQDSLARAIAQDKPEMTHNWMKLLGAWLGHKFIYNWFGFSSYLFVFMFFIVGYRLFFGLKIRTVGKILVTSLFMILWTSVALGLFFRDVNGLLGGSFGLDAETRLRSLFGYAGTVMVLLFLLLAYMMIVYSLPVPEKIRDTFTGNLNLRKKEDEINEEDVAPVNEAATQEPVPVMPLQDREIPAEEVVFELKSMDGQEAGEEMKDSKAKEFGNIGFEIEKPAAEPAEVVIRDNFSKKEPGLAPEGILPDYQFPTIDLLKKYEEKEAEVSQSELEDRKNLIIQTLRNYNIEIDKIKATVGPTVTLYEIVPAAGVRISKIRNLEDDIALSLAALGIRIIAPIPGKGTIGIEVPNKNPEIVSIHSVIASQKFQNFDKELPIVLGKTISNEVYVADLAKMPHLLIAGATGQGKSVSINVIITSLLYKKHPSQVKFVMIDPKKVELSIYQKIEKHFLAKLPNVDSSIITDIQDVVQTLNSLVAEMEERMALFNLIPVRHITEYNAKFNSGQLSADPRHRFLPYIVLIIDELADLMLTAGKEVEMPIARLAQVARAFGIHLILSTQRPSVNIITGTIKANFPARLALKVVATVDSRTILDHKGAEQLIGNGDMLLSMGSDMTRVQCPLIETSEVENVLNFIASQPAMPEMMLLPEVKTEAFDGGGELDDIDPMFEEAARIIVQHQQGSTSLIQRRLKLGYNRAGRIIDQLEKAGVVGPSEGSKARAVLIPDEYSLEQFLTNLYNK